MDLGEGHEEGHIEGERDTSEIWAGLAKMAAGAAGAAAGQKLVDKYLEEDLSEQDFANSEEQPSEEEVEDVINQIQDVFNESRPAKVNKSLKKYFKYTPQELQENKDAKLVKNELKKHFIKGKLTEASTHRKLKKSFKSYEQERLVKSFLNENKNFKPIGQNKRGDIVLQRNKNIVQITPKGKIIK